MSKKLLKGLGVTTLSLSLILPTTAAFANETDTSTETSTETNINQGESDPIVVSSKLISYDDNGVQTSVEVTGDINYRPNSFGILGVNPLYIPNDGSWSWTYKGQQKTSNKSFTEATKAGGFLGSTVSILLNANPYTKLAGLIGNTLAWYYHPEVYYYTTNMYTDEDGVNYYTKYVTYSYSDSSRTKLKATYEEIVKFAKVDALNYSSW